MIYIGQFIQSYFSTARNHSARVEKYRLSSDVGIKAGKKQDTLSISQWMNSIFTVCFILLNFSMGVFIIVHSA